MTKDTIFIKKIAILKNLLISSGAGILFGSLIFPIYIAIMQAAEGDYSLITNYVFLLISTITSPFLIYYILPLILPLVAIAGVVCIVFENYIFKYLKIWCIAAPFCVWLTVIAYFAKQPPNLYYSRYSVFERFIINIPNPEHFLFLIAPAFSAFVFYRLSKKSI